MSPADAPEKPLRSDAARNRERILEAAEEVFKTRGLEATLDDRWLAEVDTTTYELVRRDFDVLERVRCDCFRAVVVLGRGSSG